jgi:hypothetical protein
MSDCWIFISETDLLTVSADAKNTVKTNIFNSFGDVKVLKAEIEMEAM